MAHDQLLDHEYDGIQEYDNPCPGWWHAIFLLTVLFSVVYFLFFHVGNNGWTLTEAWNTAAAEDMKQRFARWANSQRHGHDLEVQRRRRVDALCQQRFPH